MAYLYLLIAIAFLCIAHLMRVSRWKLFINIYEKPDTKSLIFSQTVGYLLSYIFPFKLGDIVRAWIAPEFP